MSEREAEITYRKIGLAFPIIIFVIGVLLAWFFYASVPQIAIFGIILIFSGALSMFVVVARIMGARMVVEMVKTREKEKKIERILKEIEEREEKE